MGWTLQLTRPSPVIRSKESPPPPWVQYIDGLWNKLYKSPIFCLRNLNKFVPFHTYHQYGIIKPGELFTGMSPDSSKADISPFLNRVMRTFYDSVGLLHLKGHSILNISWCRPCKSKGEGPFNSAL